MTALLEEFSIKCEMWNLDDDNWLLVQEKLERDIRSSFSAGFELFLRFWCQINIIIYFYNFYLIFIPPTVITLVVM